MIANFALALICLAVGWGALFPARRSLGSTLYHLSALPVGVLGWSFVAAVTTVLGTAPTLPLAALGLAVFTGIVWAFSRAFGDGGTADVSWRSFAGFGSAYAAIAAAVSFTGLTMVGFDSYTHYELSAWYLADTGHLSSIMVGSRNALVPALLTGTRLLGADWTNVVFPLFSLTTLALVAFGAWHLAFARLGARARVVGTVAVPLVLAVLPPWLYHSFFVHSNMVSAMYLTLAVIALFAAAGAFAQKTADGLTAHEPATSAPFPRATAPALTFVAGLALAGLALARPDGIAYAFVGLVLAFVLHFSDRIGRREVLALYAGLFLPVVSVYGAAIAKSGMWTDAKLKASWAIALIVAMGVMGVVTVVVPRIALLRRMLSTLDLVKVIALIDLAIVGVVAVLMRDQFALTVRNMVANLFFAGGWGMTWVALVVVIVIALVFWTRDEDVSWRLMLLLTFVQYMAIALAVHGVTHPGRIKLTDSFNRAALHIVPVAFLFVAAYIGSLLRYPDSSATGPKDTSGASEAA